MLARFESPHLKRLRLGLVFALVSGLSLPGTLGERNAWAGEKEDNAVITAVDKVLNHDIPNANFGEARRKLRGMLDRCKRGCSGPAVARVYVAIGLIAATLNNAEEAKTAWSDAFSLDANAALPSTGVSAAVRQQFDEARKAWLAANPAQDDVGKAGWVNKQAQELARAATAAAQADNTAECIEKNKSALTLEENMRARLHLAGCEEKAGKFVDALRDYAKALEGARTKGDASTARFIQERVKAILPKLAHVKFERPTEVTDLQITFDDRTIPEARLGESFTIDPGSHTVHAEGLLRGARVSSDEKFDVKEGETALVKIKLKPVALTKGQLECMVSAKTQEEILACLPKEDKPLRVSAALEMSGYTDSINVHIWTPAVRGSVASPTAGWNVGANYLVDVVTAASPDVVSTASRRFHDVRHVLGVTGGYKPGSFGAQAYGNYSEERDYISRSLGIVGTADLYNKQITPALGYSYTWDTQGRTGTPYDVFSRPFNTHEINAGSTFVLTPTSLLVFGGAVQLENGDQSKTYRYIPIFEPGVSVPVGASIAQVNANRLPAKPLEQLPLERQRFSVSGRYIARIGGRSTFRIDQRIYRDTWAITSSSTDARYLVDLNPRLRVWPHLRIHVQSGASFYNRVYGATLNSDGSATIPRFRTNDRELSPMAGVTGGGGVRYALTAPGSKMELALYSSADVLFNYYVNTLYITSRLAAYGTVGIEANFE